MLELQQRFQFRISTVLLLLIPVAIISLWLANFVNDRPIAWVPFNKEEVLNLLESERAVLIFATAEWDATAKCIEQSALDTFRVRKLIRKYDLVPMRADFTDRTPTTADWMKPLHRWSTSLIIIYNPDSPFTPTILEGMSTEQQVIDAIKNSNHPP